MVLKDNSSSPAKESVESKTEKWTHRLGPFKVYADTLCQGIPLDKNGDVIPMLEDKEDRKDFIYKQKNWWKVKTGMRVRVDAEGSWHIGPIQGDCGPDGICEGDKKPSKKERRAFNGPDNAPFTIGMLVAFIDDPNKNSDFKEIEKNGAVWAYKHDDPKNHEFTATKDGVLRFQQNRCTTDDGLANGFLSVTVWFAEPPDEKK